MKNYKRSFKALVAKFHQLNVKMNFFKEIYNNIKAQIKNAKNQKLKQNLINNVQKQHNYLNFPNSLVVHFNKNDRCNKCNTDLKNYFKWIFESDHINKEDNNYKDLFEYFRRRSNFLKRGNNQEIEKIR
jgi:hypothetical protein